MISLNNGKTSGGLRDSFSSFMSRRGLSLILAASVALAVVYYVSGGDWAVDFPGSFGSSSNSSDADTPAILNFDPIELPPQPSEAERCAGREGAANNTLWNSILKKHSDKIDDKFTVAIQTYKRPDSLNQTLGVFLNNDIPSLYEVVIVWNEIDVEPPHDFVSDRNVSVRYRKSRRNSLNEKLWADPMYKTKAILLHDDDVHYPPSDIDFVFNTWRETSQDRLTGAFGRCIRPVDGKWQYTFCRDKQNYAMVLTGLVFSHIAFLEYYSSDDDLMTIVRDHVDDVFNCEDIGFNFMTSMLTCKGPLEVEGFRDAVNTAPRHGISTVKNHAQHRSACVNNYVDWFGYMPLHNVTEYIRRGTVPG